MVVKSGFGSGYLGEGPSTFSYVLQLLKAHGAEIDEVAISKAVMERADASCLTAADLRRIQAARPLRPRRWHEYVRDRDWDRAKSGTPWSEFSPVIPFAIVDPRLGDLALSFWEGPDDRLMTAYRRLEDIVRDRSGIDEHGTKLFSQAFMGPTAKLCWPGANSGQHSGRAQLFIGVFSAYRNPRAHREVRDSADALLGEFLLVNQLFRLESEAKRSVSG